jgi:hypothetical protein
MTPSISEVDDFKNMLAVGEGDRRKRNESIKY